MGARVVRNNNGRLALVIHYQGRRWWEGTTLPDTPENREDCVALARLINRTIKDGTFPARYIDFFPGGNQRKRFAPDAVDPTLSTTFAVFADAFLERCKPPQKRDAYYKAVKSHLEYLKPAFGRLTLGQISRARVLQLRKSLLETVGRNGKKKLSVKTVRNIITGTLGAILAEAREQNLMDHAPSVRLKWKRQIPPRINPFTAEERDKVVGYFAEHDKNYWPFVCVLAWTGMRPGEATALRWGDVDLENEVIEIRGSRVHGKDEAAKTEASVRTLRELAPEAVAALKSVQPFAPEPDDYVFVGTQGKPIRQANMRERRWYKALRAAKIRTVKLYALRHTFISQALTAGCNTKWISEYTGTSPDMINRVYGRFMTSDADNQLARFRRPQGESQRSVANGASKIKSKGEGE